MKLPHIKRAPSLKQSQEIWYDPDYDIDRDERISQQIYESNHDEHSVRNNDDVISVGNMSLSTINNHEMRDYPGSLSNLKLMHTPQ